MAGDLQVRIGLVVAKQDVVARLTGLDEIALEQQRLGFRAGDGGLERSDLPDHVRDPRTGEILLEIRRHPLLEVARLADI